MKNYLRSGFIVAILGLYGCASQPTKQQPEAVTPEISQEQEVQPSPKAMMESWQATGRFAIKQADKGANVSFNWRHSPNHYQIRLFGPFGSGAIYITGYPTYVELKEVNGKITRAQSPESLLEKVTGWQLPISGLVHWIQAVNSNPPGNRTAFSDQGWNIVYDGSNKINLSRSGITVKMVITSWQ